MIHNETAGTGSPGADVLVRAVESAGYRVAYQRKDEMDLGQAQSADVDLIVIAGGDGTVAKVIAHLPDRSVPLAILPTGTANNVARSIGIGELATGIAFLSTGAPRHFEVGVARWGETSRGFVEAAGLGPMVAMIEAGSGAEGQEKIAAGREVLADALAEASALDAAVEADGEPVGAGALMIEILNIGLAGPNLRLVPEAASGDGALDLVWLAPERREDMLAWLQRPEQLPPLEHRRVREVIVRGTAGFRLDDDTFDLPPDDTLTIGVDNRPVHILTGADDGRG